MGASGVLGGASEAMLIQWVVRLAAQLQKGDTGSSQCRETRQGPQALKKAPKDVPAAPQWDQTQG